MAVINHSKFDSAKIINGTSGNDTIRNGYQVYSVEYEADSNVTINGGEGNDYIYTSRNTYDGAKNILINGGDGNDTLYNWYCHDVTLNGGDGNDSIKTYTEAEINGDAGNDTLVCDGFDCTATGGTGADVFVYHSDGRVDGYANFFITDYEESDVVSIEAAEINDISTTRSGNVVFQFGTGSIILENATGKIVSYIDNTGTNHTFISNSWNLNGTTATYGTSTNAQITITGVKSLDGITLSGSTVTIANSALNSSDVTINDGYYLALANDVTAPVTTAAGWTISGTTANYKAASNTAGYTLLNNQIMYTAASGGNILVTVSGVKEINGLTIDTNAKTVTVANSALNQSNVSISNGYTLALGNDATQSTTTPASWTISGTTATYKSASNTAGYTLNNNQIIYTTAGGGNTLVTVSGVKSTNGLTIDTNAKTVTVANSALNQSNVTISNGYTLALGNDVTQSTTTPAGWTLNGTTATYKAATTSASYKLANNQISYVATSGGNSLVTVSGVKSVDGLTLNDSTKTVTVANSALNQSNVSISSGYTLALGNDVTQSQTTAAGWSLNGTTATYKAATTSAGYKLANNQISYVSTSGGDSLVTVSGVKSTNGLTFNESTKTVTVANSSLNQSNVIISSGYTLALGNDVSQSTTAPASWTISGTTATYKAATTSAGYKLANNQISYVTTSGGDPLVTVSGVKSTNGLTFNDSTKTVTVANSALNQSNVSISNGYTLALGNDVTQPKPTAAGWSLNGTTATYKAATTSDGYTLASDGKSIVYSAEKATTILATINGVKSTDDLSIQKNNIKPSASALSSNVSVSSDYYGFEFTSDYKNATVNGSKFDETIKTSGQYMVINVGAGDDSISVSGKYASITGDNGDKYIATGTNASKATVQTGGGNDTVSNKAKGALIDSKGGKDQIVNTGANVTIDSGASNDTITNSGAAVLISSGDGEDWIISSGAKVTINGGKGNDFISAGGDSMISVNGGSSGSDYLVTTQPWEDSYIDSGAGNDTLIGGFGNDTLIGNTGNDVLTGNSGADIFVYNLGDGNDTITDYATEDIINIASGTAVTSTSGDNLILTVGKGDKKGTITILDGKNKVITYFDANGDHIYPDVDLIVNNSGKGVSLLSNYENDTFNVTKDEKVTDYANKIITIDGSALQHDIEIIGNKNKNSILGSLGNDTLNGANGNDTLEGSAGNDFLTGGKGADVFVYNKGDGNDVITDYNEADTIQINDDTITKFTPKNGNIILTLASKGKITVTGGKDKFISYVDAEHPNGATYPEKEPVEYNKNGTAVSLTSDYSKESFDSSDYSDYKSVLVTINAAKVTHELNITGNGNSNYITGTNQEDTIDGGKGDDILYGGKSNDTINGSKGNDTLYGGAGNDTLTGGAGADIFVWNKGDGNDVITDYANDDIIRIESDTVARVRTSKDGKDKILYLDGGNNITVKGGNADDLVITYFDKDGIHTDPETVKFNKKGTAVTVTADYTRGEFNIADYYEFKDTVVTINASATDQDIEIIGNKKNNSILGGLGNDAINGANGNDTLEGGKGNDTLTGGKGADVFVYNKGDGNDVITDYDEDDIIKINNDTITKFTPKNGNLILTLASKGKITVTGGKDKFISYVDAEHPNVITYPERETVEYNKNGTAASLTSDYSKESFEPSDYSEYKSKLITINASAVDQDINILGNAKNNNILGGLGNDSINGANGNDTLEGGKGNDTLEGGKGNDIFVYRSGGGKDIVTDYNEGEDKVQIASGAISDIAINKGNVIFTIGKGNSNKLTLKDAGDQEITYIDAEGIEHVFNSKSVVYDDGHKRATLTSAYSKDSFEPSDYSEYKSTLVTINAAEVTHELSITGNDNSNYITGTEQDDYIDGGKGKDTLYGGDGDDTLVGGKGNDSLNGGAGNDSLWGGAGTDTLFGGDGNDIFVYNYGDGKVVIEDFNTKLDRIMILSGEEGLGRFGDDGNDAIINFSDGGQIVVQGAADKSFALYNSNNKKFETY